MKELTVQQKKVLDFLVSSVKKNGYPPTVREIGEHFGFLWAAARGHLRALERKGFIRLNPAISRGIEIVGFTPREGSLLPVAGTIRAGRPVLAAEDVDAHLLVDASLFPAADSFCLRVTGDSMVEAGIFEGDYVIVKQQRTIESGEIGVVLVGDEATVKRVFKEKHTVLLKPENKTMKPVRYDADEVVVAGKVIGVIRKL
ncbi:MAG: transcriptional repressor LexA [Nitrospirota bacterium]